MARGWLLDTNVLSETLRPKPDATVMRWLGGIDPEEFYVSVLTLGELRKGLLMLGNTPKRARLARWLDESFPAWFGDRVIAIDQAVCLRWASLLAEARRPLPAIDSLIAASAAAHDLVVATRNVGDFALAGVAVENPWTAT